MSWKCRTNSVSYQAKCTNCDSQGKTKVYDGETARNLVVRSREHLNDLKNGKVNSFMKKHIDTDHEGNAEGVTFTWKVLMKHRKPLRRQLHEAVNINNKPSNENLNSKSEFHSQRIKRINLENQYNCKICGSMASSLHQVKEHERKFHTLFNCTECQQTCYGECGLREHIKNFHNKSD